MGKYRKRPVTIESYMFSGSSIEPGWPTGWLSVGYVFDEDGEAVYIMTLEGEMKTSKGDYIIKGVDGEFYPCKPDIFAKTYEQAD